MYDIIIIGAGPAGLTAGIYARRSNKKVLILEANTYGGAILNAPVIENYPVEKNISGYDFATKLYNQTKDLGVEFIFEKVININNLNDYKEVITNKNTYKTKSIIIATGAENRKLGIDREEELLGKGISYCATCDGPLFKNKDVAVIGGTDNAIKETLYLSEVVNKVYLIHKKEKLDAEEMLIDKLNNKDNIEVINNNSIKSLNGNDRLESITLNSGKIIDVSCLFVAIGRVPENENFRNIINMNEVGYIIASEDCHTNVEGIFVAGDNRTKRLRQLVTATCDGAIAAMEAVKYVNKQ
ncbi:MAG: FAD-dependent oxidoreductase [Bacilli bacterium]|nr:FAD-dependent oxidoreductase [Bacilli bacterium]